MEALKKYGMWGELNNEEHTRFTYQNVPFLLQSAKKLMKRLVNLWMLC